VILRAAIAALALSACTGTTGEDLVTFAAAAAGPEDAAAGGGPLEFDIPTGFHVRLETAKLHVGALYLNQSVPISGAAETGCILPGIYVAEVVEGRDVDLLSSTPQPFPVDGHGTTVAAKAGEVWLTGGDVDAPVDDTPILVVSGTATGADGVSVPFDGTLTIGKNRVVPSRNTAQPGANPICKQRIVTPIVVDLSVRQGGTLLLRADPRLLFSSVDFTNLGGSSTFDDQSRTQASRNLYQALHAAGTVYRFEWKP
jgi:hypothetical protein